MSDRPEVSRREFIIAAGAATGAALLGVAGCDDKKHPGPSGTAATDSFVAYHGVAVASINRDSTGWRRTTG